MIDDWDQSDKHCATFSPKIPMRTKCDGSLNYAIIFLVLILICIPSDSVKIWVLVALVSESDEWKSHNLNGNIWLELNYQIKQPGKIVCLVLGTFSIWSGSEHVKTNIASPPVMWSNILLIVWVRLKAGTDDWIRCVDLHFSEQRKYSLMSLPIVFNPPNKYGIGMSYTENFCSNIEHWTV